MADGIEQATAAPGEKRDVVLPNESGKWLVGTVSVFTTAQDTAPVMARVRQALAREFLRQDVHITWDD